MATFKVGQRVKKIAHHPHGGLGKLIPIGTEGTITGEGFPYRWNMRWDGYGERVAISRRLYGAEDFMIAPLTPPDSWASEQVRKLIDGLPKHVEPTTVKEKA